MSAIIFMADPRHVPGKSFDVGSSTRSGVSYFPSFPLQLIPFSESEAHWFLEMSNPTQCSQCNFLASSSHARIPKHATRMLLACGPIVTRGIRSATQALTGKSIALLWRSIGLMLLLLLVGFFEKLCRRCGIDISVLKFIWCRW